MEEKLKKVMREHDEALALFRHGIISPVLYEREEGQNSYFRELAEQKHLMPGGALKKFSVSTFKSWLAAYRKFGYAGLLPRARADKGKSRIIPQDFEEILPPFIDQRKYVTHSQLYRSLIGDSWFQEYATFRKLGAMAYIFSCLLLCEWQEFVFESDPLVYGSKGWSLKCFSKVGMPAHHDNSGINGVIVEIEEHLQLIEVLISQEMDLIEQYHRYLLSDSSILHNEVLYGGEERTFPERLLSSQGSV